MNKQHGFTLLEILVALTIFAILAGMTSYVVYNAFETRKRIVQQGNELNTIVLAIALLNQDTKNSVARTIFGDHMQTIPALIGQPELLEFTRDGILPDGSANASSSLLRVAYQCQDHQLNRRYWDRIDSPHRYVHHDQILLTGLTKCRIAYINAHKQRVVEWQNDSSAMPVAIELAVAWPNQREMRLLFALAGSLYAA